MSRLFKKFLSGCLLLTTAGCAAWALHLLSPSLLKRALSCSAPCQRTAEGEYKACSPIEPRLQLMTTADPHSRHTAVWYRATVKNDTCEEIELDSRFFVGNQDHPVLSNTQGAARVVVFDGKGNQLRTTSPQEGVVIPYAYDLSEIAPYLHKSNDPSGRYEYIVIPPGTELAASHSILSPHRNIMTDRRENGSDYSVGADVAVAMRNPGQEYAVPPAGFRRLDEYILPASGHVTAKLQINQGLYAEHVAKSRARRLLLRALYFLSGSSKYSKSGGEISVESKPASLEISR